MVRVLLVGKGPPDHGGIPTFLLTLMRSDLSRSHTLEFLNLARTGNPQGGRLTSANVRRTAQDILQLWRRCASVDVTHIHTALAPDVTIVRAGLLAVAARLRGTAVVVHAHGGLVTEWVKRPGRRWLLALALTPAQRVVAVSSSGRRSLAAVVRRRRLSMVTNGVDVDTFAPVLRRHVVPRILYVGLLTPRKGVLDLFEASKLLVERGIPHELWLVGGTPDEGVEAEGAVRAAVPQGVRMLGARPAEDMPAAYAEADVFCLPSWWEAMPLSLIEAMASGLPAVATDVGDVRQIVGGPDVGLVVPPGSPQELAKALEEIVTDSALRQAMGKAARRRAVELFSTRRTVQELDHLYSELGPTA